jgi:hypothetical protein
MDILLQGSDMLRHQSGSLVMEICSIDHTFLTADAPTLDLFDSFIPLVGSIDFVNCISYFIEIVSDFQLMIDSNILKDLLMEMFQGRNDVVELFIELLHNSVTNGQSEIVHYLVEIGVLHAFIEALQDETWSEEWDQKITDVERGIKEVIRIVMKSDERYHEMISEMEMPESLKKELMRDLL